MNSREFMRAVPDTVRPLLPTELRGFRVKTRTTLVQLALGSDPRIHYEVWNLGKRRSLMEVGLHFETRQRALNTRLLRGFTRHMVEVKAALGMAWEAEQWDKGWTKVSVMLARPDDLSEAYLADVCGVLANAISVLQPIFLLVQRAAAEKQAARKKRR